MTIDYNKVPFPWFGGKQHAAPVIWAALGDPMHYAEPFCGSLATLLRRPHVANRTYYSETVNDLDGLLVNAWRSIQLSPDATAEAASWPVSEADLHARHLALLRWRAERQLEHLMGDPAFHDPVMGGWWLWGQSSWIGGGWCSGVGPWVVDSRGWIAKREGGGGARKKRPDVANDGKGTSRPQLREQGVWRQLLNLVNDGKGANRPQLREQGVWRQPPHLGNNGQGANHAGLREPAVGTKHDFHPMTMPELRQWFRYLSARLRHVRILNGSWTRLATDGALKTLSVRKEGGHCGVFLDPPYSAEANRADELYTEESLTVAHDVRAWCAKHSTTPWIRIVLAGFDGEHDELLTHGWRVVEWFKPGFLRGGMGNLGGTGNHQQKRERLWLSPQCAAATGPAQGSLWGK